MCIVIPPAEDVCRHDSCSPEVKTVFRTFGEKMGIDFLNIEDFEAQYEKSGGGAPLFRLMELTEKNIRKNVGADISTDSNVR